MQAIQRIRLVLAFVEYFRIREFLIEEALQVIPTATRVFLTVGQNTFLSLGVEKRVIEAPDWLAALGGEFGADARGVFEAGDFVAAGAAVMLDQGFSLGVKIRVVNEAGLIVVSARILLSHQVAGDVAGFLPTEAEVGHDGRLLDDEFMAVVRAFRVLDVKNVGQIVFGVVGWADVFMFVRTIRLRADAGIVNPADDVIVIRFLADATEVRGNVAADFLSSLSDGMAREATERIEHGFAVRGIATGLLFERGTLQT